ncbi:MAG: SGNH/GDSL hydrolase family protein [Selenomonadaceae bacterium]|nr:SGNH/GDSL hydrolase family protein [Selenomonadaceae bacterium]
MRKTIKVTLSVVVGLVLCFSSSFFIDVDSFAAQNKSDVKNADTSENNSSYKKNAQAATITDDKKLEEPAQKLLVNDPTRDRQILRLCWDIVPGAVKYEIFINGLTLVSFTNGIEIPVDDLNTKFQVNAVSLEGNTLQSKIPIAHMEGNPISPRTTTEFNKMKYPPLYPVYSWIPTNGAHHYEVELLRNNITVRRYITPPPVPGEDNFDFYDKNPVLEEGNYYWRVRGVTVDNQPLTQWSEPDSTNSFIVERQIKFCALGDSITHGGGAISVPPSTALYNWETYCTMPIKNLGRSGDTTAEILDRFDSDVLPFSPEVLFIMAGVNDYRSDISAWETIENLALIRNKCYANGIRPVFITPTPLNSDQIQKVGFVEAPPYDWQERQRIICEWISKQDFFINVNDKLVDANGNLNMTISIDGLHPDADGKRVIGEAVDAWINSNINAQ